MYHTNVNWEDGYKCFNKFVLPLGLVEPLLPIIEKGEFEQMPNFTFFIIRSYESWYFLQLMPENLAIMLNILL